MSRRERTTTIRCAEGACAKTQLYAYTSQREYAEITRAQAKSPWKCTRHRNPDEVLRPDNRSTTCVLVAARVRVGGYERQVAEYEAAIARGSMWARKPDEFLPGLFWLVEGGGSGSGLSRGPGFTAHADDFPEGTRLVVTTQVLEPEVTP